MTLPRYRPRPNCIVISTTRVFKSIEGRAGRLTLGIDKDWHRSRARTRWRYRCI